jgi:hypothetical protein
MIRIMSDYQSKNLKPAVGETGIKITPSVWMGI